MDTMEWTILRERERGGLELLAIAGDPDQDSDTLDVDEEIEIDVTVSYEPGYFIPGRFSGPPGDCYPDDGADPEIVSVETADGKDICDSLTEQELDNIVVALIDHQVDMEADWAAEAAEAAYESWREEQVFNDY